MRVDLWIPCSLHTSPKELQQGQHCSASHVEPCTWSRASGRRGPALPHLGSWVLLCLLHFPIPSQHLLEGCRSHRQAHTAHPAPGQPENTRLQQPHSHGYRQFCSHQNNRKAAQHSYFWRKLSRFFFPLCPRG